MKNFRKKKPTTQKKFLLYTVKYACIHTYLKQYMFGNYFYIRCENVENVYLHSQNTFYLFIYSLKITCYFLLHILISKLSQKEILSIVMVHFFQFLKKIDILKIFYRLPFKIKLRQKKNLKAITHYKYMKKKQKVLSKH